MPGERVTLRSGGDVAVNFVETGTMRVLGTSDPRPIAIEATGDLTVDPLSGGFTTTEPGLALNVGGDLMTDQLSTLIFNSFDFGFVFGSDQPSGDITQRRYYRQCQGRYPGAGGGE